MGNKAASAATLELLDSGKPRVKFIGFGLLPGDILRIVGEYLSSSRNDYLQAAFLGVQSITLCLSQDANAKLGSCWCMGFLPSDRPWEPRAFHVDKQFSITDNKGCLRFLDQNNSSYCRIVVEVLVVKLSMTSSRSSNALTDLRNIIAVLRDHLYTVKHVVISVTEYASFSFSLSHLMDEATGSLLLCNHQQVLYQIVDDLDTCWEKSHKLNATALFAFYFKSKVNPTSERHLAKCAILLNDRDNRTLFEKEASYKLSNKIAWVYHLESIDDLYYIGHHTSLRCTAFHLDASSVKYDDQPRVAALVRDALCFQDNPLVERIVFHSGTNSDFVDRTVKLPRPSTPLSDNTLHSALVELTLQADYIVFHLNHLNNGYFPHLTHLSVIGGFVTGHLDSHRVPNLKTLMIEPGSQYERAQSTGSLLVREHCQSLIRNGHPWQLVATRSRSGWSLASYDDPTVNPHDDVKENSYPFIRELLLVGCCEENVNEWQLELRGEPYLKAASGDHGDRILVWAPQCVQKITVLFTVSKLPFEFDFREGVPGSTPILTSLKCHNVGVLLNGATFPHLQSLEVKCAWMALSGTFPHLKTLSFYYADMNSGWQLDAPMLQSFNCHRLGGGSYLALHPELLPYLSSLQITLWDPYIRYPRIVDAQGGLEFSQAKDVFYTPMAFYPFSNQCQLHTVLHLELTMNVLNLPAFFSGEVWQCETLTINANAHKPDEKDPTEALVTVVLPRLPQVQTLTVTNKNCCVMLNTEMPKLTCCTMSSPRSLGLHLKCPALWRIRFLDQLSAKTKRQLLDPAILDKICARPREVIFAFDCEMHTMTYDVAENESKLLPLVGPLEEG